MPVDANYFRTIQAAIAQAAAGAVSAVAPGTYVESLEPLRAVTIVGLRCAADVVVQSPGGNTSGLRLRSSVVTLEGITLRGQYTGVAPARHR